MIIDVHGHYTTAPAALDAYRGRMLARLNKPPRTRLALPADAVAASLAGYVARMDERGIDMVLLSPRASGMGHEVGDAAVSRNWTEACNDAVAAAVAAYPGRFAGVCQLPQSPGVSPAECVTELERCVEGLGFVGFVVNPDVSAGLPPLTPSLGDQWWDPLWAAAVRLRVPGMVHASATRHPAFHLNGSHYIAQHYAAVIELCNSTVLTERFPELSLIVPHGGGGVPMNMNRHRALHIAEHRGPFDEALRRLWFDTAVYDSGTLLAMIEAVGADRFLFGSEMYGTGAAVDPHTGSTFDDILPTLLPALPADTAEAITHANALRAFPRLAGVLV
ncbi:amidohydrolase family protein [Phytohabitans sp. ZYX-F-186]|uniref:Amidohydrolase family protein n=1 Tax=Phytohabitans maris TaxID=3071409 RepID=A0ABU0ZDX6_9ACTN|nr:amidohydrolase family protein [Phytohabitans sp. ZYX-F-186]MDQ7904626.1 amidohydrolase family protein [Phytohabitans sp. ZYX-F-186]